MQYVVCACHIHCCCNENIYATVFCITERIYEVRQQSNETGSKKEFHFIYSLTKIRSPSKYIPCACTHVFQRRCTVCSIPVTQLEECRLRPALQPYGCLLLIQNGVLSLPILLFEIRRRSRARDQVSKEAAASP